MIHSSFLACAFTFFLMKLCMPFTSRGPSYFSTLAFSPAGILERKRNGSEQAWQAGKARIRQRERKRKEHNKQVDDIGVGKVTSRAWDIRQRQNVFDQNSSRWRRSSKQDYNELRQKERPRRTEKRAEASTLSVDIVRRRNETTRFHKQTHTRIPWPQRRYQGWPLS